MPDENETTKKPFCRIFSKGVLSGTAQVSTYDDLKQEEPIHQAKLHFCSLRNTFKTCQHPHKYRY